MSYLLPTIILAPLCIGLLLSVWGHRFTGIAKPVAVAALVGMFALSVVLAVSVQSAEAVEAGSVIAPRILFAPQSFDMAFPLKIRDHILHWQLALGADGISSLMVLLTTIVCACAGIAATRQIESRQNVYLGLILIIESMLLGVFLSMDLLTFYIFFEAVLLPVILMIYLWGDKDSAPRAARRFLLFTLAGSIPMVVGLIGLILHSGTAEVSSTVLLADLGRIIPAIDQDAAAGASLQWILYILLFGFGIKMAIVPLHSWLPATYTAAHPNSTAIIAAVVGKLGLFGIVRIVLPLMPNAMALSAQWIFAVAGAVAIVYGALVALAQTDPRRLFAYSSISHLGFISVGLMSYKEIGIQGAVLQMFNHGIIVAAVYLLIASLELRYGRERVSDTYHGLATRSPALGAFFIFFLLAGAGLPGLNSFVGELMTLSGMIQTSLPVTILASTGILFGAWYSLRFIQQILFGPLHKEHIKQQIDLQLSEKSALIPLAVCCLVVGLSPMFATSLFERDTALIAGKTQSITLASSLSVK